VRSVDNPGVDQSLAHKVLDWQKVEAVLVSGDTAALLLVRDNGDSRDSGSYGNYGDSGSANTWSSGHSATGSFF